jgi:hypothetical protein
MKVSKLKSKVNEGFWSDFAQGKAKFGRFFQQNAELRNDPRVIQKVAQKGFLDFRDRLGAAGINLKNAASISTPEVQDQITNNLEEYVRQYMAGGDYGEVQNKIVTAIEKVPLPTKIDERTIYKYFEDTAKVRAEVLIQQDQQLSVKSTPDSIKLLQSKIDPTKELVFPFNGATVVIRKNKEGLGSSVYIDDWSKLGTTLPSPKSQKIYPHTNPLYELTDSNDEAEHAEHEKNLDKIYKEFVRLTPKPVQKSMFSDKLKNLVRLQLSLNDNQEINFQHVFSATRAGGSPVLVIIRKLGVYVSNYVSTSTSTALPPKIDLRPHGEMYEVKRPENLEKIYDAYVANGSPPPRDYEAEPLE